MNEHRAQEEHNPPQIRKTTIIAYLALGSPTILAFIMIGATGMAEDYPGNAVSKYITAQSELINQSLMVATIPLAAIMAAMRKMAGTFIAGLQPGLVYMAGIVAGHDATTATAATAGIIIVTPMIIVALALVRKENGHNGKKAEENTDEPP